jgi:hypothetical protein
MKQYAEILIAIAEGKQIQIFDGSDGSWDNYGPVSVLGQLANGIHRECIRVKPDTILVNGRIINAPVNKETFSQVTVTVRTQRGDISKVIPFNTWSDAADAYSAILLPFLPKYC